MQLYRNESSNAKWNAQRNLEGRTHYVDDDTLRFHKSRILSTHITDGGLILGLVESCAADYENTKRVFRPVIFDITGYVLERPKLEDGYSSSKAAKDAMWDTLNNIDAKQVTLEANERETKNHANEMQYLREDMERALNKTKAA